MKLSEAIEKGIFKTTVYIGEYFEGHEEKDLWVTLREPSVREANEIKPDSGILELGEVMKACIVDHNFEKDDGTKASAEEVYDLISRSSSMHQKVIVTWENSLPLLNQTGGA